MGVLFSGVSDAIAKGWIAKNECQKRVTLENLMYSDLPGYKAKSVCFEDEFLSQDARAREVDEQCLSDVSSGRKGGTFVFRSEVEQDGSASARKDGNNVDKTKETIKLATLEKEVKLRNMWINGRFDSLDIALG